MKTNTWMVVVAAIAVTASMVIAKSFLPVPDLARANPTAKQVADAPLLVIDQTPSQGVAQAAPVLDGSMSIDLMGTSQLDSANSTTENEEWTVLVVQGNKMNYVTYPSQHVKGQAP